jgi:hypothetical protein
VPGDGHPPKSEKGKLAASPTPPGGRGNSSLSAQVVCNQAQLHGCGAAMCYTYKLAQLSFRLKCTRCRQPYRVGPVNRSDVATVSMTCNIGKQMHISAVRHPSCHHADGALSLVCLTYSFMGPEWLTLSPIADGDPNTQNTSYSSRPTSMTPATRKLFSPTSCRMSVVMAQAAATQNKRVKYGA